METILSKISIILLILLIILISCIAIVHVKSFAGFIISAILFLLMFMGVKNLRKEINNNN